MGDDDRTKAIKIQPIDDTKRSPMPISKDQVLIEVTANPRECIQEMMARKGLTTLEDADEARLHYHYLEQEGKVRRINNGSGSILQWELIE